MPKVRLSWQPRGALALCAAAVIVAVGAVRLRALAYGQGAPDSQQAEEPARAGAPLGKEWQVPTPELLERCAQSPAPEQIAERMLERLKAIMRDKWVPSELSRDDASYVDLTEDPAEAVFLNYAYVAYEFRETRFWIKSLAGGFRVLVEPSAASFDDSIVGLVLKSQDPNYRCMRPPYFPDEAEQNALALLWKQYVRIRLGSFSEGKALHRPRLYLSPGRVVVDAHSSDVAGFEDWASIRMQTDGRCVGFRVFSQYVQDRELLKLWGGLATTPPVQPLNPKHVAFEDTGRWLTAERVASTTPRVGGSCLLHVELRRPWRFVSEYVCGGFYPQSFRIYWVRSDEAGIGAEKWHSCEFHALTERALEAARVTLWHPDLLRDLEHTQTRPEAVGGMHALHCDYLSVVGRYRELAFAASCHDLAEQVKEQLRRGERSWRQLSRECDELYKAHPQASPAVYRELFVSLKRQMEAEKRHWGDLLPAIHELTDELQEHVGGMGISRAIPTENYLLERSGADED